MAPAKASAKSKYAKQRPKVITPHVPIRGLRLAARLTQDELAARMSVHLEGAFTKGAVCALEKGHRGASPEVLTALERVYGLEPGSIVTEYVPRSSGQRTSKDDDEQDVA